MPDSYNRIARTLASLAALALSTAACAAIEPPETTGLYELDIGPAWSSWCEPGDDADVADDGADLMGPHFTLSMMCTFAGPRPPRRPWRTCPHSGKCRR